MKILIPGQLIIITTSFNVMVFSQVTSNQIKIKYGRLILSIKLLDLNVKQQLEAIQVLIQSDENLYAIENKPFYESYCHFLKCLQNKDSYQIPFQEQLIQKRKEIPDNRSLYRFKLYVDESEYIENLSDILDASQEKAIFQMLTKGITLIQGPPGTGKTHCGALGVKMILENLCSDDLQSEQDFDFMEQYYSKYLQIAFSLSVFIKASPQHLRFIYPRSHQQVQRYLFLFSLFKMWINLFNKQDYIIYFFYLLYVVSQLKILFSLLLLIFISFINFHFFQFQDPQTIILLFIIKWEHNQTNKLQFKKTNYLQTNTLLVKHENKKHTI